MPKLTKLASVVLVALVIALVVYYDVSQDSVKADKNIEQASIFGRNVYATDQTLGKVADPNYDINFPKDHFEHPDFDIEWWYLTANLKDQNGDIYGLQWTLFRFRSPNENTDSQNTWNNQQVYMGHASIHSLEQHWFSEKFAKGGVGNAGVNSSPFELYIDDWQWLNAQSEGSLFPANVKFAAQSTIGKITANLLLEQQGPFVKQGQNGYSIKSANGQHASHYYSAPFIAATGQLEIEQNNTSLKKQIEGNAWYDHEWTSQLLDTDTLGWDWLSLHLDDGSKIMAFRMRLSGQQDYITGSYISAGGAKTNLSPTDITLIPKKLTLVKTKELPLTWQLIIPSQNIDIQIQSLKNDQWNQASVSYYEGMVSVEGSHKGRGFLELTGY